MTNGIWRLVAFIATRRPVTQYLIRRAQRTPYTHIMSPDGGECYMGRWWLFNPYGRDAQDNPTPARWQWLPSVRIHHIMRADLDRHLHDHPWNARTIVLRGWYTEERPASDGTRDLFCRSRGYTGRLLYGQYHRIASVSTGGVWTLFWSWKKRGTWGFDVDGVKVPWRTYLGLDKQ